MVKIARWDVKSKLARSHPKTCDIVKILLKNRGITNAAKVKEFFHPRLESIFSLTLIKKSQLDLTVKRITAAIAKNEQIIVYGDYDVDGICGSAILWETIKQLGAKVMPYIPHRVDEGYGLSIRGIDNLLTAYPATRLIITVDNGVTANEAIAYASKQKIDVIVCDHHQLPAQKLTAQALVWTDQLCGAGVAWMLANSLQQAARGKRAVSPDQSRLNQDQIGVKSGLADSHLDLVALATVADLMPLVGANRILLKFGLEALKKTSRPGLQALFAQTGINQNNITAFDIGHIIAPRLNASGRLESAMDALRLICTTDSARAQMLARALSDLNTARRNLTLQAYNHARIMAASQNGSRFLLLAHESWQEGIIGLVASRVVEEFYLPTVVIARGETISKGSARSVSGFNIIEALRIHQDLFIDIGGHPMAAGFTIKTEKIAILAKRLNDYSRKVLTVERLTKTLAVDCQIPATLINEELAQGLVGFEPFGIGNPEPIFLTRDLVIENARTVGSESQHLKLVVSPDQSRLNQDQIGVSDQLSGIRWEAIGFGMGHRINEIKVGGEIDVVYSLAVNFWNNQERLQLKLKDVKVS
ncbi:single-stranded-DNA-specific exonuclease RecJ [Candidatus Daviesbacteria bacterium]|nr:single-stranded-DNA-specific exonuclease RecJ [Candidatus Daviesbacteria bacterium]